MKTVEGRLEFAKAFERLGDISMDQRLYKRAGKYYKKSFDSKEAEVLRINVGNQS